MPFKKILSFIPYFRGNYPAYDNCMRSLDSRLFNSKHFQSQHELGPVACHSFFRNCMKIRIRGSRVEGLLLFCDI